MSHAFFCRVTFPLRDDEIGHHLGALGLRAEPNRQNEIGQPEQRADQHRDREAQILTDRKEGQDRRHHRTGDGADVIAKSGRGAADLGREALGQIARRLPLHAAAGKQRDDTGSRLFRPRAPQPIGRDCNSGSAAVAPRFNVHLLPRDPSGFSLIGSGVEQVQDRIALVIGGASRRSTARLRARHPRRSRHLLVRDRIARSAA